MSSTVNLLTLLSKEQARLDILEIHSRRMNLIRSEGSISGRLLSRWVAALVQRSNVSALRSACTLSGRDGSM